MKTLTKFLLQFFYYYSGSSADLHNCTALARITPTDVNSRPSSCLTNFLLSGRSVMLEMPRRSGSKIMSHMLTSHGGEIFIHTLNISRSVLEDPPSISEGMYYVLHYIQGRVIQVINFVFKSDFS